MGWGDKINLLQMCPRLQHSGGWMHPGGAYIYPLVLECLLFSLISFLLITNTVSHELQIHPMWITTDVKNTQRHCKKHGKCTFHPIWKNTPMWKKENITYSKVSVLIISIFMDACMAETISIWPLVWVTRLLIMIGKTNCKRIIYRIASG